MRKSMKYDTCAHHTQTRRAEPQQTWLGQGQGPLRGLGAAVVLSGLSFVGGVFFAGVARARPGDQSPFAVVDQMARVLTIVENDYVDPVERDKLLAGAIKGMVGELDPHSTFLPPEDNALFQSETEGKFGGVGIEVELR